MDDFDNIDIENLTDEEAEKLLKEVLDYIIEMLDELDYILNYDKYWWSP